MDKEFKITIGICFILIVTLLLSCLFLMLTTEHYKVARYEVKSIDGHRIYFDGGSVNVNSFYFPIENDLESLSKGDDVLIHYLENAFGRTYIRIENLEEG